MTGFQVLARYLRWHYTEALFVLVAICRDLAFFWFNFWVSRYLIETLGEPLIFNREMK